MELLLQKIDEKLNQQTVAITNSITKNVMEALDDKMKLIVEENQVLKSRITELEQKLHNVEKEKRKNNLIFFGIGEMKKTEAELVEYMKELIVDTGINMDSYEISNAYRIGKWKDNKNRPIIVSFTTTWKKRMVQKNKSKLPPGIYIMEDYTKEVLERRKQLQGQLEEERKKGKNAFLVQDKLIVKDPMDKNREKRKRETSGSPSSSSSAQNKINKINKSPYPPTKSADKDVIKPGILNFVERKRPALKDGTPKN